MADAQASLPGAMPPMSSPDMRPEWNGAAPAYPAQTYPAAASMQPDQRTKDAWLGECRRRIAYYYDDGYGRGGGIGTGGILGFILGGTGGGFLGHAIAGAGDEALGAGLGAGLGAVVGGLAGSAIDKAARKRKANANHGYDYCEAYFDDYYRTGGMTYANNGCRQGCGQVGYAPQVAVQPQQVTYRPGEPICEEVVTERWVPGATRYIPGRVHHYYRPPVRHYRAPANDKRIRTY
jgi:hypothetical protein